MALYDPGAQARGTVTVMYTCSGCGISFYKKRGFDVPQTHRFALPMCRGGFEGAERLSLAVTSRDFRVCGRHASVNRPGELEADKLQRVTCIMVLLPSITKNYMYYMSFLLLHGIHEITTHYTYYMILLSLHKIP